MKDSGVPWIGNIPADWNVSIVLSEFEEVKNINKGMLEKNLLSLSYGNIVRKEINSNNGLLPDSFETYNIVPRNSLVLRLTDLQNDKRSLRSAICNEQGIITSAYTAIQLTSDIENHPRYMNYLFRCYDNCMVFYSLGNGVRQSINYAELKRVAILKPSYNCQVQIAKYLDDKCTQIDTIIAKEQSVIEKLQEYKQSVITEAVTKGLDPKVDMIESDISWIKTIPVTWKVSKLKYVAAFSPKCDFTDIEPDTEVTYTPMEYIKKGNYIPNSEAIGKLSASLTKYEEGDIVIAKVTPCFENGNIAIMNNLKSGKGLGSSELFVFRVPAAIRKFVFYWMQSKLFIEQCVATMTGTGGLKRVSSYYISNSEILLPPSEAINDICNYLDEKCELIERTIHQKELVINKLTEYKQSLIYEVVTGKKEVPHV